MTNLPFHPADDLVLIPAYEPDDSLISFVRALLKEHLPVLVVDDGSGENFSSVFARLPEGVTFLSYETNRGKGYAMKYALSAVADRMPWVKFVVTADADGQHSPKDTLNILRAAHENPDALILGVRDFPEHTPLRSRIGNRLTAKLFGLLTHVKNLEDTQTGLRAFSTRHLDLLLSIPGERYEYEMRQLMDWSKSAFPLVQVPIETIYRDKENSTSHYDTLKDSARIFRSLLDNGEAVLFTLSGILSFTIDFLLFNFFYYLTRPLHMAYALAIPNVAARLLSALLNFYLNRNYVFESKDPLRKDILQYGGLVILLLTANSLLLSFYGNILGLQATFAKLCVELTVFAISYLVQHFYIFANRK
ncbi:MAG: bifunctional glycosyltransferase family 2/GtrA family protein [Peptoniphilus sp.]|nr:bifunctional glycosyltransferase family 2/GtrA family protein [Peptoniphilus sp.]MDY3118672.1 bifunctional glycosyltransferase family 2/GtrA family protein [Peptoniphilus sp.]